MPEITDNIGLKKPLGNENFNRVSYNENLDILDTVVGAKVDKVVGKGLSENDYTTTEKNKLSAIQSGAQVNTVNSVNSKTGVVSLGKGDIGLGNVDNVKQASKEEFDTFKVTTTSQLGENRTHTDSMVYLLDEDIAAVNAQLAETVQVFNVLAYGANPILADNATAIQAAIDACKTAGGGTVFFPRGIYSSGPLAISGVSISLAGDGRGNTLLDFNGGNGVAVEISGDYCGIRDLQIRNDGSPTSGAAVRVSNNAFGCLFDALTITGFFYGFDFNAAKSWNITDSYIFNNIKYEVYIRNAIAPDSGDQVISGCTFDSSIDTDAAIRHESGGGVKIVGNKILRHKIGYDLQVADAAATSVAVITGNSIEMQTVRHARLGRLGTTGTYAQIVISGNQLNYDTALTDGFLIEGGVNAISINGNTSNGPGDKPFVNVVGGADVVIEGNQLTSWQIGTKIAPGIDGVRVGINNYVDVARPIEDNTVSTAGTLLPLIDHYYTKKITAVTSTSEYTQLFRLDMQSFRSCVVELTIDGILAGVQQVGRYVTQIITRADGNSSQTSISDTNAGAIIDIQFDNTTTAGSVIIGVRRNASAGGTQLDGVATLRITGHVQGINIL